MRGKEMLHLYWFCKVVEHGGFVAASQLIHVSAATLSRAVSQLERETGLKLLHRNAKQFQLTAEGERYYQNFSPLFHQFNEQWLSFTNHNNELIGDIHLSCPEPFADFFLQQLAIEFMRQHPKVNIHIHFASDASQFIEQQLDLAVVTIPSTTNHLVQKKLFDVPLALAASADYLQVQGTPTCIEELAQHQLLSGNLMTHWLLTDAARQQTLKVKARYSINSLRLSIHAAISGMGICLLPQASLARLHQQQLLEPVLPNIECPRGVGYLVWHDRQLISARVAAFRDLIFERLAAPELFFANLVKHG